MADAPTADDLLAHTDWLMSLARALVGDAHAADVVQDTYEVALAKPPKKDGPLRPWLGGVARNLARMTTRGRIRREARDAAQVQVLADVPSSEELVARAQTQQQVAKIVLELPEPLRGTVLLRFFEGMTAAEIARAQGIPAATVRSRLADALDRVRATLDQQHGDRRRWVLLITPLSAAATSVAATATLAGGVFVKLGLKVLVGLVVAFAVVLGTRWIGWWGGGDAAKPEASAASTGKALPVKAKATAPTVPPAASSAWIVPVHDDDPKGKLRLEGQVIDDKDQPVGGAHVAIDANPPIVVETEADGGFVFEGLIPRDYRLEATGGEGYAGPVRLRLTEKAEPVTLRMRRGGTIEVVVAKREGGAPIAGAEVELRSTLTWKATTNAEGVAQLRGVGPTWAPLVARANGFAQNAMMLGTSGDPAAPQRVSLALSGGAAIAGRVLDEAGKPVGGARVVATSASEPFPVIDPRRDGVLAGADGSFTLPTLSAGTWRLTATHGDHGPATSAPITVDGVHARSGVDLVLVAGGVVRGIVTDKAGVAIAAADVRVVVSGMIPWRARRQAFTDASGKFAIAGLPRRSVEIVAWHDSGASAIVPVDLGAKREHDVTLALDISGAIAGTVVDRSGTPIGDAQVIAEPDWSGGTANHAAWSVRGVQEAVTDQGGAFRFAGLPDGSYRVRATRPGASEAAFSLAAPVITTPNAAPIKIVIPADGRVIGKLALPDGKAPAAFSVAVGGMHPTPFASKDGTFALAAAGGTHVLRIRGLGFVEKHVGDVTITEGKDTDLGTINVAPGRSISGRVLDEQGTPVAKAKVAAGGLLSGGGAELYIPSESIGAKDTETDADGRFSLEGFPPGPITVVAGKDGVGRSPSVRIAPGTDSATLDLVLASTSGLEGKVTRAGAPLGDTVVIANPIGANASNFFTVSGADGSFAMDALAPGHYVVYPMLGGGGSRPKDLYMRRVEVVLGKRTKVDIDATPGNISLAVSIKTDKGDAVPMTGVVAIGTAVDAATLDELRDGSRFPDIGDRVVPFYMRMAMGGSITIDNLQPGVHTVCATPSPGSLRPDADRSKAKVKCALYKVTAEPKQSVAITIPAAWLEGK